MSPLLVLASLSLSLSLQNGESELSGKGNKGDRRSKSLIRAGPPDLWQLSTSTLRNEARFRVGGNSMFFYYTWPPFQATPV